jgi:hypothetical protein
MSGLVEQLTLVQRGHTALLRLYDRSLSGSEWQFFHKKEKTGKYTVAHVRDGCFVCDLFQEIADALEGNERFLGDLVRELDAAPAPPAAQEGDTA